MPQSNSTHAVERREIPSLSLRAAVVPESINPEARTVDVVWTTGARVLRGFWDQFYEELSLNPGAVRMERLNNGAPLLDSHQAWSMRSVIGVVVPGSAKISVLGLLVVIYRPRRAPAEFRYDFNWMAQQARAA